MHAVKYTFVGVSGSRCHCELFDPEIHVKLSTHGAVIVVADAPILQPRLRLAYAVSDLSQALQEESRNAVRKRYQQADLWFCERYEENSQTRQRLAADLTDGRYLWVI